MKKWGCLFFILLLVVGYKVVEPFAWGGQKQQEGSNQEQARSDQNYKTISVETDQIYKGNLLLVNKDYPVHQEGVASDVVNLVRHNYLIDGYALNDGSIELSEKVAESFLEMVQAASADDVNHFMINSGYRGFEEQRMLYEKMGSDYALPEGYSEHNLGLSLDIGSTQMKMDQAPEGKWLKKNAWKYGFILRYPEDKVAITGIQYEPWHYRYLGLPHSAIIQEKNFTLEEYLDYLKEVKETTVTALGESYRIFYYPVVQDTMIQVPANRKYVISGDNREGVIVTVYP
ncbi:M15 family metallopeptidase [Brevibacillus reuszeri]|uniref:M15 family metallopeptidase n=1 Tax=Brevibacillus reuszeri TaxID=54915 RepID=UPI000CCBEF41|nr:M15 family metallopeptidase [Brevibacillus reuszeri]